MGAELYVFRTSTLYTDNPLHTFVGCFALHTWSLFRIAMETFSY